MEPVYFSLSLSPSKRDAEGWWNREPKRRFIRRRNSKKKSDALICQVGRIDKRLNDTYFL